MILIWIFIALLTIFYCGLILNYWFSWNNLSEKKYESSIPVTSVSIIIPARNEAKNIGALLTAILNQDFPEKLLELIVVDDHSTDETSEVATKILSNQSEIKFQILHLSEAGDIDAAYKKKAIDFAIQKSVGDFIITTDADCVMNKFWLKNLVAQYESTGHKMIAAPVKFSYSNSFFQKFQALDFIGLIGITAASVQQKFYNMCNGANLCYEKKAFFAVNGFKGNDNISSGDDMFLMHKIAQQFPNQISFLKSDEVCVMTHPKETLDEFLNQRLRWTSKSTSYSDKRIIAILVMAYLFNCSILICFLAAIFNPIFLAIAFLQFLLKAIVEFIFLKTVTKFFQQSDLMKIFIPAQFIHIFYVIAVGLLGQFGTFNWKGRELKK